MGNKTETGAAKIATVADTSVTLSEKVIDLKAAETKAVDSAETGSKAVVVEPAVTLPVVAVDKPAVTDTVKEGVVAAVVPVVEPAVVAVNTDATTMSSFTDGVKGACLPTTWTGKPEDYKLTK